MLLSLYEAIKAEEDEAAMREARADGPSHPGLTPAAHPTYLPDSQKTIGP